MHPGELHGTWTLNDGSVYRISGLSFLDPRKLSAKENTIEIRSDGSCRFNTYTSFHPNGNHLASSGTWRLKKGYDNALAEETWYVEFELNPNENTIVGTTLYLKKLNDRPILYGFIDDPDQKLFLEFERVAAPPL